MLKKSCISVRIKCQVNDVFHFKDTKRPHTRGTCIFIQKLGTVQISTHQRFSKIQINTFKYLGRVNE